MPLVNRVIPVIEDRYVEIEFGTGCLKVTPCHDPNDYMLGKKHNLESIDIFNADGTVSSQSPSISVRGRSSASLMSVINDSGTSRLRR